jgi:parallel beta-helix repeat protein
MNFSHIAINGYKKGSYFILQNCTINNSNSNGVVLGWFDHVTIENNTIKNTGLLTGMGSGKYTGIYFPGNMAIHLATLTNALVQYNEIDSVGYNGISFPEGNNITVSHNFINHFGMVKDDGGGIYIWEPTDTDRQKVVSYNIVLNGAGNMEGTTHTTTSGTYGIYCDDGSSGVHILNNSVANTGMAGIFLHNAKDIYVENNTTYDCNMGLFLSNNNGAVYMTNINAVNNIFFSKTSSQYGLNVSVLHGSMASIFTALDDNYYSRPIDDNLVFAIRPTYQTANYYNLADWQAYSGFDNNSHKSSIKVAVAANIYFYYNTTRTNKVITLDQPMIDGRGTKYFNSITLLAFTSAILIVDPNPSNQPPVVTISNPIKGNKYESPAPITIDAVASDPDGTISKVELYNGITKLFELTSPPYSFTLKNVKTGTYSITAIATDNLNATTTSSPIEFVVGPNIKYDANSEIIKLYPNPNDGHFSIEFINPLQNEKSEILITDLAGKQVYNGSASKEDSIKQIDLSYIKSGIYILIIICKKILVTKKFIKN